MLIQFAFKKHFLAFSRKRTLAENIREISVLFCINNNTVRNTRGRVCVFVGGAAKLNLGSRRMLVFRNSSALIDTNKSQRLEIILRDRSVLNHWSSTAMCFQTAMRLYSETTSNPMHNSCYENNAVNPTYRQKSTNSTVFFVTFVFIVVWKWLHFRTSANSISARDGYFFLIYFAEAILSKIIVHYIKRYVKYLWKL